MKNLFLGDSIFSQFFQVLPITLLLGLVYFIFRIRYLKRQKKKVNYKQELLYLIFICYLVGLFNLVLVPSNFWSGIWHLIFYGYYENLFAGMFEFSYNFIPTLYKVITGKYLLGSWVITMIVGNVLMFIPMGILLNLCCKKINNKNIYMFAILIPFIIEIIQPIVGRSIDIDDLIMNFLGIVCGYFIIVLFKKILNFKMKSRSDE